MPDTSSVHSALPCTSLAWVYKFIACIRTICVHMALNKSRLCVRIRVPIMNMYGSFCGRYVRVLFAPRNSCVRARSKDAAHLPFSLHPPPLSHVHFPSLLIFLFLFLSFLSLSLSLSFIPFFLSLLISAYVDYATMSHTSPPSFFLQWLRNVYQRMRQSRYINNVFFWNVTHNMILRLSTIIQIMGVIRIRTNDK